MAINRIIHFIWLGKPPSKDTIFVIQAWKTLNPSLTVNCWYDSQTFNARDQQDMQALQAAGIHFKDIRMAPELRTMIESKAYTYYLDPAAWLTSKVQSDELNSIIQTFKPNYSAASDILRYNLLHHFGGIYADIDVVPRQPIPEDLFTNGTLYFKLTTTTHTAEKAINIFNPDLQAWDNNSESARMLFERLNSGVNTVFENLPIIKSVFISSAPLGHVIDAGMKITGPSFFTERVCNILNIKDAVMVPTTHIFPKNTYFDHLYLHSWVTSGNIRPEMTDMLIAELEKVLKTIAQEYPEQDELPPIITINTKGQKTHRCYFARYLDLRDKHCKNETDPFWISKDSTLLTAFAKAAAPNTRLKRSLSANQDPEKPAESNDEQYAVMDNLGDAGPFFLSHYSDTIDYLDKKPDLNKHALLIVKAMLKSTETRYPLPYSQPFANLCSTYCQKLITEYSAPEHESRADSTVFLLLIYLMQFHDANRYFEVSEPTSDIDLAPMSFHDPNDPPYFKFCGSDGSENEKALSLLERLIDGQLLKDEPLEDVNEFCWGLFVQVAETFFTGMDDVSMLSRCASDAENDEDFMDYLGEDAPGLAEQKDEAIKIYHLYNKISNAASFNEAPSPGEKKIKL